MNRVFKDKQGGLVVDYIGSAQSLKAALKDYIASHQRLAGAANYLLGVENGKKRFADNVLAMSKAFSLCCGILDEAFLYEENCTRINRKPAPKHFGRLVGA